MDFERPLFELEDKLVSLKRLDLSGNPELVAEIDALAAEIEQLHHETYVHLDPWDRVQISRHPERPKAEHYIAALFDDVLELHGDRAYGDDEAVFAGLATIGGRRVALLAHRKGTDTKSNIRRNFGSAHPEGFRKAMRVMRLADKFGLPIVSLVDTQGAFPGMDAEERGQGWAIAESLAQLSHVRVPVVAVCVGEGGSGGALAIGFGDRLMMLENSYYSVITPEACASIIYHDSAKAQTAADCLKLTAADLVELGIVDEIIGEPLGGAHRDPATTIAAVGDAIERALGELSGTDPTALVDARYERLRGIGVFCTLDEE
jgi:acetyl-CoA carboxylase carboxyl transferase subunit alpha